jgi:Tfp pilus assembly protein PilN
MLVLNIIPTELKKEIKFKKIFKSTNRVLYTISASVLFYALVLVACQIFLNNYFSDISSQNILVTKKTDNFSKQIKDINKQISSIENIQNNNIYWSPLIQNLFNNLPNSIKLDQISFNKKSNSIAMSGIAGTRDSLISLRKYFENNKNFTITNFPIQNLVEKQNINFAITLNINSYVTDNL